MPTKLYVGGLADQTSEEAINEYFAQYGNVVSVSIIKDREPKKSKRFGFVEMSSSEEAMKAINALNSKDFDGRKLTVNQASFRQTRN